ncbi:MAG: hypothetical protein HWN79_01565 [Candidatus Lokiarchaeota archaeon]|nr:hypothetical protein [Candidatus Lokiarchaeota archaeon]
MKYPNLTFAQIEKIGKSSNVEISTSLSHIKEIDNYRNLLIIKSETSIYAKFTVYPTNREKIIKILLAGLTQIDEYIEIFSRELQKYKIIHSSGLVFIDGEIYFECYLDLSLDDEEYKGLKIFLDKNKSKFKDIKIEELSLSRRKVNPHGHMEN